MPQVSVVMPVYNGERFLAEAIDSILTQTFTDFELIIVDDGSQDRSAEIVRQYVERDGRVRFFQLERNMGRADARNHGVFNARGSFITNMDCDDVSLPERLEKQVAFLKANPDIGALGACTQRVDEALQPAGDYIVPPHHGQIALSFFLNTAVTYATVMMRRDVLLDVGAYQPGRRDCDDSELISRLLPRTRFAYLPDKLMLVRKHEGHQKPVRAAARVADIMWLWAFAFRLLWKAPLGESWLRLWRVREGYKMGWADNRRARRDLQRLVERMIDAGWAAASDKPQMQEYANRLLERTTPRRWQMFCHWRRHRFGR